MARAKITYRFNPRAMIGGLLALATILFSPWLIQPVWVIPLVLAWAAVGWLLGRNIQLLTRWLTLATHRREQVDRSAHAAFHTQAVSATRHGTGLLIYASILEDSIRVLPDHPLSGRIDQASWAALEREGAAQPAR